jgi:hypothetical protein
LFEELNGSHAQSNLHIFASQYQDIAKISFIRSGIKIVDILYCFIVEYSPQFLKLIKSSLNVFHSGELIKRAKKE